MIKGKDSESTIQEQVAHQLSEAGFEVKSRLIVGQAQPDLLLITPEGQNIVIEVKQWAANPENIARAAHQAKRYKELTKATAAFVVMAGLSEAFLPLSVLPVTGLAEILETTLEKIAKEAWKKKETSIALAPEKRVFVAMPFNPKYDDTFLVGMQPAAISVGAVCERVDHAGHYGDIVSQIKDMILNSSAVIADLSESRPNVCYEIGLAEARRKPVIQICGTSLYKLPFDLRNNATIKYSIGQTTRLQKRLKEELKKIF